MNKKKYNILLYGDGASSNIFVERILSSDRLNKLYIAGQNEYIKSFGIPINADNLSLIEIAQKEQINFFICDSEVNNNGITSAFIKAGIKSLGVTKKWTRLEASKQFGKFFALNFDIPIPKYKIIKNLEDLKRYISKAKFPFLLKEDGYAKGLGSNIVNSEDEAINTFNRIKIKNTINKETNENHDFFVLAEEFIFGEELSYITVWTGNELIPICAIKDYKKLYNGSQINTASMGAYYSPEIITPEKEILIKNYHLKLEKALRTLKANFTGPIYTGLIFNNNDYYVLEYNMRFGTSESAIIFSNLNCDFINFVEELTTGKLKTSPFIKESPVTTITLYPQKYPFETVGEKIEISADKIEKLKNSKNIEVFLNKVKLIENKYILTENSCIYLVSKGINATNNILNTLDLINLPELQYRRDIGI